MVCFRDDSHGSDTPYQIDHPIYYNKVYERLFMLILLNLRFLGYADRIVRQFVAETNLQHRDKVYLEMHI